MRSISVAAAVVAAGLVAMGAAPVTAGEPLLEHPGPDGLVWVPEQTGDGGVVSAGASDRLATRLTVACEGGGSLDVTMYSQRSEVAAFTVDCPVGAAGVGSATMEPGVVQWGSWSVGVDASVETTRWSLTVVQPE